MENKRTALIVGGVALMGTGIYLIAKKAKAAPPTPPGEGVVTIGLKNPPDTATQWEMSICDWDITTPLGKFGGSEVRDNIALAAEFEIPKGDYYPLRITNLSVFYFDGVVLYQLYHIQSWHPYLWDFDLNDWSTEPDPDYREIFISEPGNYLYNVALEQFERVT